MNLIISNIKIIYLEIFLGKIRKKKPINGLFLFFSSAILLILTLQLVDFFINLFFGLDNGNIQEKKIQFFHFCFF